MRSPWVKTALVLFVVCVLAGGIFGNKVLALNSDAREALRLYTEMLTVAHESFGGEVTYGNLVDASIEGMVRQLDPHTSFLSAEAYGNMRDRQQSSFYGLGILVGSRNGQLTVITPIEGTPASRMGLRAGDVIGAIEGELTKGIGINEAVGKLKGPKGTAVTITIFRPGKEDPFDLTITRDEIPQDTVRYAYMIDSDTGYIAISDFNRGTGREVAEAVETLQAQGMKALLIDLRNNGGGLLDQAIAVVEQFVHDGAKVVETRGRSHDSSQAYFARGNHGKARDIPLVVLVNEGTASAAEIFAGAVQDHDIGLIVGTPTWGKGLVQTVYSLSYGAGLALTTAKYYTPSGRLIQRDYSSWFDYATHTSGVVVAAIEAGESTGVQAYSTDLGRRVYGGGGITPDVKVEPRDLPEFLQFLLGQSAFFDFAVSWASGHAIESRAWSPPDGILEEFEAWILEQSMATEEEMEEGLSGEEEREFATRYITAELMNSAFGIEARYQVLANGDLQIQEALALFDRASELLAERLELDQLQPEKSAETVSLLN